LKSNFLNRSYPEDIVDTAINRASNLNRLEIIKYKTKEVQEWKNIPFVLTFNNAFVSNRELNIYNLLSKSWEKLILTAPELNTLLTPKILFKKFNTFNDILVSTKFPPPRWSQLAIKPSLNTITTSKIQQSLGTFF